MGLFSRLAQPSTDRTSCKPGRVLVLLGAAGTGKTTLCQALVDRLLSLGYRAQGVDEMLRVFCDQHKRLPTQAEQAYIAHEQSDRIEQTRQTADWVVADTSAWMTALYSAHYFNDSGLYPLAQALHRGYAVTVLTGLDVPWQPDDWQRGEADNRAAWDVGLRASLAQCNQAYHVVAGSLSHRVDQAMTLIERVAKNTGDARAETVSSEGSRAQQSQTWQAFCPHCET
jgi:nicotinamide riboside kinase